MPMSAPEDGREYLTVQDVLTIHEVVVESDPDTPPGVSSPGDIEYVVEHVNEGHFGQGPETMHETAAQLLRLLVANHPFVDGNKRTALASTVTFYALNGYALDYDRELKEFLKRLAQDERAVELSTLREYLDSHTKPLPDEYRATYRLWQRLADRQSVGSDDQNGYSER